MLSDPIEELCARISSYEFLLEILYARACATISMGQADIFLNEIKQRSRAAYVSEESDLQSAIDRGDAIMQRSNEILDGFLDKVRSRADNIRE